MKSAGRTALFRLPVSRGLRTIPPFRESAIIDLSAMKANNPFLNRSLARRAFLAKAMGAAGSAAALHLKAAEPPTDSGADYLKELEENERKSRSKDAKATIGIGDKLKITKVETFM